MLAKLAYHYLEVADPPIPVIVRFCGTSPGSENGRDLVNSVIQHMHFLYGLGEVTVSTSFNNAVTYFHELLAKYPVVLLIDSLDQLSNADLARSKISFLKDCKPHKLTRIVLSTLPDELDANGKVVYWYGGDSTLTSANVPRLTLQKFNTTSSIRSEGETGARSVLESILRRNARTLTSPQWELVLDQANVDSTALYLNLCSLVFLNWSSRDDGCVLAATVPGIVSQILNGLEVMFGCLLTRTALGLLSYARAGLSDTEILDLLSLDETVLGEVFQYSEPTVRRVPVHVWRRLRLALEGLVVERDGGLLTWYHRQLREASKSRYHDLKSHLHSLMARYFAGLISPSIRIARHISAQPVTLTNTRVWMDHAIVNRRRGVEAAFHLVQSGLVEEAVSELCNVDNICGMVKSGHDFEITLLLAQLLEEGVILDEDVKTRCAHYYRWLRKAMTKIVQSPASMIVATGCDEPLCSTVRQELQEYIRQSRVASPSEDLFDSAKSWTRSILLGGDMQFTAMLSTLLGFNCHPWLLHLNAPV